MRSLVSRALSLRASRSRFLISAAALLVVLSSLAVGPVVAHDTVAGPADVTITIRSGLSDRDVRVRVGAIVRFVNSDDDRHRMRSRSGPHEFDTGNIEPGEAYQIRLSAAGTYTYIDERNDDASAYRGRIVVAASGGTSTASGGSTAAAGGSAAGGGAASSATVSIGDDFYQPTSVQIAAGGSVMFRNTGGDEHSATSSAFDTGVLAGGASARKTFTSAGTFDFLCMFHSDMRGTIQVVAAGNAAAAPEPVAPRPIPTPTPTAAPAAGGAEGGAPTTADVAIADFSFGPGTVEVAAGGSVEWTNTGVALHTVDAKDGTFKSGMLDAGSTFRQTFTTPGTYAYLCAVHPEMAGTVRVVAAGGAAAAGAPAAAIAAPSSAPAATGVSDQAGTTPAATPTAAPAAASSDRTAAATASDVSGLAGIVLTITLVSAAAALFSRVIRGTVRTQE